MEAPALPSPLDRPTLSIEETARYVGISKWAAYQAAKTGDLPTLRIGGRILVPTARLAAMLGIE